MVKQIKQSIKALVVKKEIQPTKIPSAESFIRQAINKKVPVETMERLLAMRKEYKEEQAKEAYITAMSQFQAECPIIRKDKKVNNKDGTLRYIYAPIDSILRQTKHLIQKYGFSYTIDTTVDEKWVDAVCKITHILGHTETSNFKVPIDSQAFMNEAQKFASALTFAKRYAFCNAFGILTGDEDDDSIQSGKTAQPKLEIDKDKIFKLAKKAIEKEKDIIVAEEFKGKIVNSKLYSTKQIKELIALIDEKIKKATT
ncbi:MAG: hypothetical protein COY47_04980 [Chloroflexi bacterium CG_4_10_14_0_8_um_filter_57_5]|nr:MAG: hypothetical protein COY47_04980 [Chloroflexi bacterium CG_4_10_14_0_8_um_filter_57_5]